MCDTPKPKIFISYAHEDKASCEALKDHLGWLFNSGQIDLFDDSQIKAGDDWNKVIKGRLAGADIVIMLVSAKFTRSKYCTIDEMRVALEGRARVIPILVSAVDFEALPLSKNQALPKDQNNDLKPVDQFSGKAAKAQAWADISKAIRQLVERPKPYIDDETGQIYPALPALNNLPHRAAIWVGREETLERLMKVLRQGTSASICAVGGMGGIGKTTLATEAAYRLGADAFPDGILRVDMRGLDDVPPSSDELMGQIWLMINPGQKLPEDLIGSYDKALRGKRTLLIFDNARDSDQVEALRPPPRAAVLITSREKFRPEGGTQIDLDLMAAHEAVALLGKELGDKAAGIDLERLAELCRYLPLALHVAAGTIRGSKVRSAQSIMAGLAKNPGGDLKDVQAQLALSLDVLKSDDDALYQRYLALGVMEAGFTAEMAAAVMGVEADAVEAALETLIDRSLLMMAGDASGSDEGDAPRFRLHDLLRGLAKDRLDDDAAYGAGLRHVGHCRDLLWQCRGLTDQGGDPFMAALQLFDRERGHIEAGQRWLSRNWADDDAAATIAAAYPSIAPDVVQLRLHSREQITWFEMQAAAARHCGDKQREGNALGNLGSACARLGETSSAIECHEQHRDIAHQIGDRLGEGTALGNLGIAYKNLGETSCAIEYYEQALTIMSEISDQSGEGSILGNLGTAYAALGKPRRAIEYYEQQLAIAREIGDLVGEATALWNTALAHETLGEEDQAIEKAKAAFVIYRALEDPNKQLPENWLREHGIDPDEL